MFSSLIKHPQFAPYISFVYLFILVWGPYQAIAQELLLALHPAITPLGALGIIGDAGDQTQISHMQEPYQLSVYVLVGTLVRGERTVNIVI